MAFKFSQIIYPQIKWRNDKTHEAYWHNRMNVGTMERIWVDGKSFEHRVQEALCDDIAKRDDMNKSKAERNGLLLPKGMTMNMVRMELNKMVSMESKNINKNHNHKKNYINNQNEMRNKNKSSSIPKIIKLKIFDINNNNNQ